MPQKYKVNVLGLQGRGKKVYRAGEEITETQLPEDNAKELVKKGFLVPVGKSTDAKGNGKGTAKGGAKSAAKDTGNESEKSDDSETDTGK